MFSTSHPISPGLSSQNSFKSREPILGFNSLPRNTIVGTNTEGSKQASKKARKKARKEGRKKGRKQGMDKVIG